MLEAVPKATDASGGCCLITPSPLLHHTSKLVSTTTSLEVKQKTPPGEGAKNTKEGAKRRPKERYKKKTQRKGIN